VFPARGLIRVVVRRGVDDPPRGLIDPLTRAATDGTLPHEPSLRTCGTPCSATRRGVQRATAHGPVATGCNQPVRIPPRRWTTSLGAPWDTGHPPTVFAWPRVEQQPVATDGRRTGCDCEGLPRPSLPCRACTRKATPFVDERTTDEPLPHHACRCRSTWGDRTDDAQCRVCRSRVDSGYRPGEYALALVIWAYRTNCGWCRACGGVSLSVCGFVVLVLLL